MSALTSRVLIDALDIQNALIHHQLPASLAQTSPNAALQSQDESVEILSSRSELSWGFHSPLMYWNCSALLINNDGDLLQTIQEQSTRQTNLNLTLLPVSVFSGKQFSGRKLMKADGLVITHFERFPARGPTSWDTRLVKLAAEHSDRWSFYPTSGAMTTSQLYQYQRELISSRDFMLLGLAYLIMFFYVGYRLKETRGVRSRVGLFAAVLTEVIFNLWSIGR